MKLLNIISYRFFWVILIFSAVFLIVFGKAGFAESPGIKITEPADGSTVVPGQEITVTIEPVGGFVLKEGFVGVGHFGGDKEITTLPTTISLTIPNEAVGKVAIIAFGYGVSGLAGNEITLNVQLNATLQSLAGLPEELSFETDWNGNIKDFYYPYMGGVYGMYSDGIKRDLSDDPNTTYASTNPEVISIDEKGKFQAHKVGQAAVIVSNSGVSRTIPVVFESPRGIRPSETIPPTTTIDIQPPANEAGWHNQDITITITAQDNEGGSGVQYIDYRFPRLQGEYEYKRDKRVIVPFSQEGEYEFWYCATDNEANREDVHSTTIHLDKTPPQIKISASPDILWPPNHKMVNVTVNGSATDTLSDIASTTFKVTDEYGKVEPKISKFSDTIQLEAWRKGDDLDGRIYTISVTATDYAGNKATTTATVTVPHDMAEKEKK